MGRGGAPELDDYPPLDIIPQTWGLPNTCPNQLASGTLHAQLFDLLSLLTFVVDCHISSFLRSWISREVLGLLALL